MTRTGDMIEDPVSGQRITFLQTAADTSGDLLRMEAAFRPGGFMTPHVHSVQEERIQVVSGHVRVRLGRKEEILGPGESLAVPPRTAHAVRNEGTDDARFTVDVRPAGNMETAIETLFGLARDGKVNRRGLPRPLQGVLLAREYGTFIAGPPISLQKATAALLAPLARLSGYRARYPAYSGTEASVKYGDNVGAMIEAPPQRVWQLVADVTRMGDWSPICVRCEWLDGWSGPEVGARFLGHNRYGRFRVRRVCEVRSSIPDREFAFTTLLKGRDSVHWRYEMRPSGSGTEVLESYRVEREPAFFRLLGPFRRRFRRMARRGMEETLARIKEVAEAPAGNRVKHVAGDHSEDQR